MKLSWFFLIAVFCFSCDSQTGGTEDVSNDALFGFDNFPDSLFLGLYFDQPIEDARKNLEENNFELLDSSGSWSYLNKEDSNEIILPAKEKLHSFKLIMKSERVLKSVDLLHGLFKQESTSGERSSIFSVYNYDLTNSSFKVSVFEQQDFIRLQFEQRISK